MLFFSVPSDCLYLLQTFFSKNFEYGLLIVVVFFFLLIQATLRLALPLGRVGHTFVTEINKQNSLCTHGVAPQQSKSGGKVTGVSVLSPPPTPLPGDFTDTLSHRPNGWGGGS